MIELKNITKKYIGEEKNTLENLNMKIETSSFNVFIGSSGCGKSTILKLIAGLEEGDVGEILRDGNISMVFQNGALLPWLSIYENVAFPLINLKISEDEKRKKVVESLEKVELLNFKDKLPREISGGQRQRIGIARALVLDSNILLLDEPFSALDIETTYHLHDILIKIWKEKKQTIILVSHSLEEAVTLGQKIYLIDQGKIKKEFENKENYPRDIENKSQIELLNEIKKEIFK